MSWLGDKLRSARDAIQRAFSSSPPACASTRCVSTLKTLNPVVRKGDGVFKHDANGNIAATKTGGPFVIGHGGAPGEKFVVDAYELELKDGSKVEAYKSLGRLDPVTNKVVPDGRMESDCHGVTFTNGEYWINNDQVDKMLVGGGFKNVAAAQVGDVMVFRDPTGQVAHSVTITQIDAAGKPTQVSGLGGIEMAEHYDKPADAWYDPNATQEIWRP